MKSVLDEIDAEGPLALEGIQYLGSELEVKVGCYVRGGSYSRFSVLFTSVAYYQVMRREAAHVWEREQTEDEAAITRVCESPLKEFLEQQTLVFELASETLNLYCVALSDDWIHVVSSVSPKVKEVS